MTRSPLMGIGWLVILVWLLANGGTLAMPSMPWLPIPGILSPVTAAVYVYEKDNGGIPPAVSAALSELNTKGLRATAIDDDVTDGSGAIPEQYAKAIPAAREAGLPALVVMAGESVRKVVKAPTAKEEVLEAAK